MATPLIPFTLAWLIGIWIAARITLPTVALSIAVGAAGAGVSLTWRILKSRWFFALALAAILGALRFNLAQPHFDQTTLACNDQPHVVAVEGIVVSEPDTRDAYSNLRVEVNHLLISNLGSGVTRTVHGLMLVQALPFTDFRYGDHIRADDKLQMVVCRTVWAGR